MRKTTKLGKAPAIRAALAIFAALALAFALTGCDNPAGNGGSGGDWAKSVGLRRRCPGGGPYCRQQ